MKKLISGLIVVALIIIALTGAYWWFELRWRPETVVKHQAEIAKMVEEAGWVSPRLDGPKLYVISAADCADCTGFIEKEFEGMHKAGVDTRVIMIARDEENGQQQSTAAERATVAELWLNRGWPLFERWSAAPVDGWTGQGVPPADGDMARTAVVEAGRGLVRDITPLLKDNGVTFAYPVLIWWTKDGEMKACACDKKETYRFVRRDLGA